MAYSLTFDLYAPGVTLGNLRAQFYDSSMVASGSAVATGFSGTAPWFGFLASVPDALRGFVQFYDVTAPTTILGQAAINPEDAETPADTAADAATLVSRLTAARAGYLDNLSGTSGITVTSRVNGTAIAIQRGDTNTLAITGLGVLTGRTKLYFTAKSSKSDADAASIIQIEETGGLLYLNAATTTTSNGTLVVDDATAGNVTITLKAAAAAALSPAQYIVWDIEMVTASAVTTLVEGTGSVTGDVTRAVA